MLHSMWGQQMILQLSTDTGAFASSEIHLRGYKTLLESKTQKDHFRGKNFVQVTDSQTTTWLQIPKWHIFPL